jgi:hypothetical protein
MGSLACERSELWTEGARDIASQPVTVSNPGNQLLTASNLAITANFTQSLVHGSNLCQDRAVHCTNQLTVSLIVVVC